MSTANGPAGDAVAEMAPPPFAAPATSSSDRGITSTGLKVLVGFLFVAGLIAGAVCGSKATVAFGAEGDFWPWLIGALCGLFAMILAAAVVQLAGRTEMSGAHA